MESKQRKKGPGIVVFTVEDGRIECALGIGENLRAAILDAYHWNQDSELRSAILNPLEYPLLGGKEGGVAWAIASSEAMDMVDDAGGDSRLDYYNGEVVAPYEVEYATKCLMLKQILEEWGRESLDNHLNEIQKIKPKKKTRAHKELLEFFGDEKGE